MLAPGMEYYSVLLQQENVYTRYDFCVICWETSAKNKFSDLAKTIWKAKVASKKEMEDLSIKTRDEKAFLLLKEALQKTCDEDWAETFVLALYLVRRKLLF